MSRWNRGSFLVALSALFGADVLAHDDPPPAVEPSVQHAPSPLPDRVVLTWAGDPTTSQDITWRTDTTVTRAFAEFAVAEAGPQFVQRAQRFPAASETFTSDLGSCRYHSLRLTDLEPKTKYAYRVGDGVNWTEWYHFTTASADPEPFSFIYFGDAQNDVRSLWSRVIREAHLDLPRADFMLHAGDLINRANEDAGWGEWFGAGGGREKVDQGLRVFLCGKTAQSILRHRRGRMPKCQRDRTPLIDAQQTVPDLIPAGLA